MIPVYSESELELKSTTGRKVSSLKFCPSTTSGSAFVDDSTVHIVGETKASVKMQIFVKT